MIADESSDGGASQWCKENRLDIFFRDDPLKKVDSLSRESTNYLAVEITSLICCKSANGELGT